MHKALVQQDRLGNSGRMNSYYNYSYIALWQAIHMCLCMQKIYSRSWPITPPETPAVTDISGTTDVWLHVHLHGHFRILINHLNHKLYAVINQRSVYVSLTGNQPSVQSNSCRQGCVCVCMCVSPWPAISHLCGLVGRAVCVCVSPWWVISHLCGLVGRAVCVCVCLPDRRSAICAVL